jgi:hypothetical protein
MAKSELDGAVKRRVLFAASLGAWLISDVTSITSPMPRNAS